MAEEAASVCMMFKGFIPFLHFYFLFKKKYLDVGIMTSAVHSRDLQDRAKVGKGVRFQQGKPSFKLNLKKELFRLKANHNILA